MDSVKSTVTVLEEGDSTGVISTGGGTFQLEDTPFNMWRRGSSSSGVGGHISLGEGCTLIVRRGHTFAGQGVHFDLEGSATSRRGIFEAMEWS